MLVLFTIIQTLLSFLLVATASLFMRWLQYHYLRRWWCPERIEFVTSFCWVIFEVGNGIMSRLLPIPIYYLHGKLLAAVTDLVIIAGSFLFMSVLYVLLSDIIGKPAIQPITSRGKLGSPYRAAPIIAPSLIYRLHSRIYRLIPWLFELSAEERYEFLEKENG